MLPHTIAFPWKARNMCVGWQNRLQLWLVIIVLGIDDPWIWGVYLLCIISALLCVIYGIVNWNKEGELEASEIKEEADWEASEEEMQKKELGM
jgi:hypothetical protein